MERAKHNEYYASILAVVLLLAPQLSFARGMSGGGANRAGISSFSSAGSRSARMVASGPRVLVPSPGARAFRAARNIQPFMTAGARTIGRSSFSPISPNGRHLDFRHRPRIIINRLRAPVVVVPFQPYFGYYPYCNSFYFGAYGCPSPYTPFAPVYVPVPVPSYADENPYAVDNSVGLPADNADYTPSAAQPTQRQRAQNRSTSRASMHFVRVITWRRIVIGNTRSWMIPAMAR